MKSHLTTLGALLLAALPLQAEPGDNPPDATVKKPSVERLSKTRFRIDKITFDSKERSISMPCTVNMVAGLVEYGLVLPHGKSHESVFITHANPFDINIALKLLSYPACEKYFPEMDKNFRPLPHTPPTEEEMAPSLLKVRVDWELDGKKHSHPLNELILDNRINKPMPAGRWLYTGSVVENGEYLATNVGDVLAILNNKASVINYIGVDKEDDEIWVPAEKKLPPPGTQVTLTFLPANPGAKAKPAPAKDKPAAP